MMKASTVRLRNRAGNSSTWGAEDRAERPESIITPQEMVGGRRPIPRKDRAASAPMKPPRLIMETTITGPIALGRMCERTTRKGPAPSARAAAM